MHSVVETEENGFPTAVAVQTLWMKNNKLYWPPGKNVDRRTPSVPQANWLQFDCKLLKTSIETFEEALELERMYSKHRDSNSFRQYNEQKKLKRQHPVNHADQSNYDLIDVNDMIRDINANAGGANEYATFSKAGEASKYHENCMEGTAGTVKPVAKTTSSAKSKTGKKDSAETVKKFVKKPLPFQRNYLKSGIAKAKDRCPNVTKRKFPRYDNFLKSAKRFDDPTGKVKAKNAVPCATITKDQYSNQIGVELKDGNDDGHENFNRASTPIETHKNYNFGNNAERIPDRLNTSRSNAEQFRDESDNEQAQTISAESLLKNVNVPQDISIRPATTISSQIGMTFEERVLKELSDLKKNQVSFEERIESRIGNFFNEQSRLQSNSQSSSQTYSQSRSVFSNQSRLQGHNQSRMQGNHQSAMQYQSRPFGGTRNEIQIRHRETVSPERYSVDFEQFEELDQNFPVRALSRVEELEFAIRKDIEFKFLLNSRLNELGGTSYKKCIRLKMKYLFSDKVLELYSWKGTEEKNSFQKLKALNNLVLHSVRDRCPNTERDEYNDYMIQWIKHARSRQRVVTYTYPDRANRDEHSEEEDD